MKPCYQDDAITLYHGDAMQLLQKLPEADAIITDPPFGESHYVSYDGGPRLMGSVIYARSCHGYAVNETQKPEAIVMPLVQYSVPKGGLVVDCFAGSGTTLAVARKTGRRAIGIEKRESQCRAIIDRLAQSDMRLG